MTDFIVDTSVISAFAPGRQPVPEALAEWVIRNEASFLLPVIVVAEIEQGIAGLKRRGGVAKAAVLTEWRLNLLTRFVSRIVPLSAEIALELGALSDRLTAVGRHPGLADASIAATALVRAAPVLTRNVEHFEPTGVQVIDPFTPSFWSHPLVLGT